MEALVKLTQENLSSKPDNQLRRILRREFTFVKGTTSMTSQELIDKIQELAQAKQDGIDSNSGIDQTRVHKDVSGKEWKINNIKDGLVHIENSKGHKTNVTIALIKSQFQQMRYRDFTEEVVEKVEEIPVKEEPKKRSKSDLVRHIIRKQIKEGKKSTVTSGTVMKELEDEHQVTIHRSFCSTLINQVKNG